jgi:hypothetical protein
MASPFLGIIMTNEYQPEIGKSVEMADWSADGGANSVITADRLSIDSPPNKQQPNNHQEHQEILLVASLGNPVAYDYADYVRNFDRSGTRVIIRETNQRDPILKSSSTFGRHSLVIFLNSRKTQTITRELQEILKVARDHGVRFVGLVSSFKIHLGDRSAKENEDTALRAGQLPSRNVIFRPGHILSPRSPVSKNLRRFGPCYPLVPKRLRSCFVNGEELFTAIESERRAALKKMEYSAPGKARVFALLGPNVPWKALLARYRSPGIWSTCATVVCQILSLFLLGTLAGLFLDLFKRSRPSLRSWNFDTLRPSSFRELFSLYNKYNHRHIKVVGYNNGVIHFGHHYPGKTVVSTVYCNRVRRAGKSQIKADCGATIRQGLDFLTESGQELPVIPNYSYVCLGTALFVPIHGSASDFSTVADTITRIILFDPILDRLIVASRNDPEFCEYVYNLKIEILLLRLYLQVKPKSRYFVHRQEVMNPSSQELVDALRDRQANNVEIRKSRGSIDKVTVYKYYLAPGQTESPVIELPRDTLGRLWDRLEENSITSFLMHALTRYFAWHVELFFSPEEFAKFWESHRALPIRKIQLRYIRKDGFPHSPFRDGDCVSVDMFMLRRHRSSFESYLKQTLISFRTNPGKHSR